MRLLCMPPPKRAHLLQRGSAHAGGAARGGRRAGHARHVHLLQWQCRRHRHIFLSPASSPAGDDVLELNKLAWSSRACHHDRLARTVRCIPVYGPHSRQRRASLGVRRAAPFHAAREHAPLKSTSEQPTTKRVRTRVAASAEPTRHSALCRRAPSSGKWSTCRG